MAHQLNNHVNENKIRDLNQASSWLGLTQSRLSHIIGLLQLSPLIQTDIMTDDSPILDAIPEYKIRDISSETDWSKQADQWQEIKKTLSFRNSISDSLKTKETIPSKWILQS